MKPEGPDVGPPQPCQDVIAKRSCWVGYEDSTSDLYAQYVPTEHSLSAPPGQGHSALGLLTGGVPAWTGRDERWRKIELGIPRFKIDYFDCYRMVRKYCRLPRVTTLGDYGLMRVSGGQTGWFDGSKTEAPGTSWTTTVGSEVQWSPMRLSEAWWRSYGSVRVPTVAVLCCGT
jgi:hypothetical protein